jgi:hypothetical protein
MNIFPRQISAHIELAGIPRPVDRLRGSEEPNLVSEFHGVSPAREQFRAARLRLAIDLNRFRLDDEGRRAALGNSGLADDRALHGHWPWRVTQRSGQFHPRRVERSGAVQKEKSGRDQYVYGNGSAG